MNAIPNQFQPEAATPYQHVCPDVDCCYYGQPSFRGCGCYKTREQMMADRIEELTKALERARVSLNAVAMTTDSVSFHADVEAIDRALSMPLEKRP